MTISFDFDHTLWDPDQFAFRPIAVMMLWFHLNQGHRVIITTTRVDTSDIPILLKQLGITLDVYSAPGHPGWDYMTTKSDVLLAQKVSIHYDDAPKWEGLRAAHQSGIKIISI